MDLDAAAHPRFTSAATPPLEALDTVDRAARRAEHLAAAGLELHFELDETIGRITATLRELDGRAIRRVGLLQAIDLLSDAG
jgi:hypothetical protein